MKIAIIGATGLVGREMIEVLEEQNIKIDDLILAASEKSIGKTLYFKNNEYPIVSIHDALKQQPNVALFSAGANVSLEWAPLFAQNGCYVIDNSSAWRKDKTKKLIVPEVNGHSITKEDRIIANPNCSTIQLVVTINPLHIAYRIKRIVISTYQSVTGTGAKAVKQLENERNNIDGEKVYPYQIDMNCFPHGGTFLENGYTTEEMKLIDETRKIIGDNNINISPTVVRIPVIGGHSESVNIEFYNNFNIEDVYQILNNSPGITVIDDITSTPPLYPMPIIAKKRNDVLVGRIRQDLSQKNSLNLWIVADNLRKGAATNAIQILNLLIEKSYV